MDREANTADAIANAGAIIASLARESEQQAAEIERLRSVLEDICATQMVWNGGIAKHRPEYLYGFIEELREIAREGLKNGWLCLDG